jgi:hypothetical protein
VATATVPAGGLETIELPWVQELKGAEFTRTEATTGGRQHDSILVPGGAYHLTRPGSLARSTTSKTWRTARACRPAPRCAFR